MANNQNYSNNYAQNNVFGALQQVITNEAVLKALAETLGAKSEQSSPEASATWPSVSENEATIKILAESLALQSQPSTSQLGSQGEIQQHISDLFRPKTMRHVIGPKCNTRSTSRVKRSAKRFKGECSSTVSSSLAYESYRKTLILLRGPNCKETPKGEARKFLFRNGFVIEEVFFQKSWSASQVLEKIKSCFFDVLPYGTELELLNSVRSSLFPPKLESLKTVLDGEFVHRIWKQKPIYVRPSVELLPPDKETSLLSGAFSDSCSNDNLDGDISPNPNIAKNFADISKINSPSNCMEMKTNEEFKEMPINTSDSQIYAGDLKQNDEKKPTTRNLYDKYLDLFDDEVLNLEDEDDIALNDNEVNEDVILVENKPKTDLKSILMDLTSQIQDNQICFISVNRKSFLECVLRAFQRPSFNASFKLNICFTDDLRKGPDGFTKQQTFDAGGPTREFLGILIKEIMRSQVFTGPERARMLNLNSIAREKRLYFYCGIGCSLSLVHGGLGPRCLSEITYYSLVRDPNVLNPSLEDISDYELRANLEEISNCEDLETLQNLAEKHSQLRFLAGSNKPIMKMADKEKLLKDLLYFCVFINTAEPRQMFMDGLKTLGVYEKMVEFPEEFKSEFCFDGTEVTASKLISLFSDINYSEEFTMKFDVECKAVQHFMDYFALCDSAGFGMA